MKLSSLFCTPLRNIMTANLRSFFLLLLSLMVTVEQAFSLEEKVPMHGATFVDDSSTDNQEQVAIQLDSIVNPTESQSRFLDRLASLSLASIHHDLNQLSGQQHTADLFITDYINRQFIRRLYDPLRSMVSKDPCHEEWYEVEEDYRFYPWGIDIWGEASGSRLSQKGNRNEIGFKADSVEGTIGFQKTFLRVFTVGIAGSYEYDHVHYKVGGTGNMNSVFGGVYGLYRPSRCYVLADIAFGYSVNKLRRSVNMGKPDDGERIEYSMHSNPKTTELTFYSEVGVDLSWEDLLIQPFFGVEVGRYHREGISEHGAGDLDVKIGARDRTLTSTRLGVHLSCGNLPSNMDISIDLAWNYRCTPCSNEMKTEFSTFGSDFIIEGIPLTRNYFDGALTLRKEIFWDLSCYGRFSGEAWKESSAYTFLLGVEKAW